MIRSSPIGILISAIGVLIAITIHEYAHAWAADKLGDPTPRLRGRLTLNPLKHLDVMGTLLLLLVGFGWAKPVEINPRYFSDWRRSVMVVASAGPLSNIVLAFVLGLAFKTGLLPGDSFAGAFVSFLIRINIALAIFNLIPIHPLDGSKILSGLLPPEQAQAFDRMAPYGTVILLVLLIMPGNLIGDLLRGPTSWLYRQAVGL
jgi:Zn-dependent protease